MATVEEVLNSMDNTYVHDDIEFEIDKDLRVISVPAKGVILGVVGDKNINRINFSIPKMYNGFDLSGFSIRINYKNANGAENYYNVVETSVENDKLYFNWLVDYDVTEASGIVYFSVYLFKENNGLITNSFNTSVATGKVLDGLSVGSYTEPTTPSIDGSGLATFEEAKEYLGMTEA